MINLLPPPIKEQLRYAKLNARAVHYLWLIGLVLVLVGSIFIGANWYLRQRIASAQTDIKGQEATIASFKDVETKAKQVNDRLSAIKQIQANQAHFSTLLADLASVTPKGVIIKNINLTGDPTKPVQIQGDANSYSSAVAFRDALATSPRIAAVDIQNVTGKSGATHFSMVIAYKAGQSR